MYYALRPDSLLVWRSEEVKERLSWYYEVMKDRKPAKYLICKRIPVEVNLTEASEEELWEEHKRAAESFRKALDEIVEGEKKLEDLPKPKVSFLDLKIELVKRMLTHCNFCERRCGVNRAEGVKGFCRLDSKTYVSSWFHHWGEEAPLVPSGTIFFGSCNFRCVFCQNYDISQLHPYAGIQVNSKELAKIQATLRREGVRNINYVGGEPTPNLHTIIESLKYLDVNVPLLWNSNMYCSVETITILLELIDIALPDFKYGNDSCAKRLSMVDRYFEVVSRNHKMMHDYGIDMIIRHLVMPNHVECCTKPILEWIAENLPRAMVNIMGQYRPEYLVAWEPEKYPDIARRPSQEEMEASFKYADELGICYRPVS
ncbi:MAG: pyruvate formate lyase-activating protein [Candidatus Methanomethylicota archaeon]|uniref:Pyruvate formate lyase-activating protein n=1 Tax=Thermoproteota archaeon TaxID=2056631 RepID=A0A497F9F8_9CREN|nr:MAG: pyruvate formate lyase-activating protein [Candidatus Verstraetearchaeota archaeon]RLE55967.1 MAG: pyruvate formate lyase-activating protein [Candidatus Verstraetearchaeota archaeon]